MQYLFEIIMVLPFLYCLPVFILRVFFNCRLEKPEFVRYMICCSGSLFILYYLMQSNEQLVIRTTLTFGIVFILLFVIIKEDPLKMILSFAFTIVVVGVCEVISFAVLNPYLSRMIEQVKGNNFIPKLNLIPYMSSYLAIYVIYYIKKSKLFSAVAANRTSYALSVIIALILIDGTIVVVKLELMALNNRAYMSLLIFNAIFLILTFVCSIVLFIQSYREKEKNREILQYQQAMVEMYDSTRMFRHNFTDTMTILHGYCVEKDYRSLELKLDELMDEIEFSYNDKDLIHIMKIENIPLKWFMISKASRAQKNGVKMKTYISDSLENSLFEKMSLIQTLAILADNAIDAAEKTQNGEVEISIIYKKPDTLISIRNSVNEPPDIEKIFEKNYTTKKGHQGIGLYNVKKILSKYSNIFTDIRCEDNFFQFDINILNSNFENE